MTLNSRIAALRNLYDHLLRYLGCIMLNYVFMLFPVLFVHHQANVTF